jgi:hypothetical protein
MKPLMTLSGWVATFTEGGSSTMEMIFCEADVTMEVLVTSMFDVAVLDSSWSFR